MPDDGRKKSFMPMYWGDFLADTSDLSCEELGMYIRLISHYWNTGPLPQDHTRLARVCNLSKHKFEKNWQIISRFFSRKDGKYFQKRIDKEIEKAIEISEKRAEAGRLGGIANAQANAKQTLKHPQPHITVSNDTGGKPADPKAKFWREGVALLTKTGRSEKEARSLLGKLAKEIGSADEAVAILALAADKVDPASYLTACMFKIHLPRDVSDLRDMRQRLGLDPFGEDQSEIVRHLRAHPEDKPKVQDFLDHARMAVS